MRLIDLTGKTFGELTVIKRNGSIDGGAAWLCVCTCGETGTFRGSTLRNGDTTSCGHVKREKISKAQRENLTGQMFGFLKVIKLDSIAPNRQCKWRCECLLCGGTSVVYASNLKRNHTISDGCLATSENETKINLALKAKNIDYIHGYRFDDLTGPGNGHLEFDFALLNGNKKLLALIEYQGEQHYRVMPNDKHFGELQREYTDNMKKEYCKKKNIPLYEIRFDEDVLKKLDSILSSVYVSHVNTVPSSVNSEKV